MQDNRANRDKYPAKYGRDEKQARPDQPDNDADHILQDSERTRCEVYSRVMGYHRPVDAWNTGKRQEFRDRVYFRPDSQSNVTYPELEQELCQGE